MVGKFGSSQDLQSHITVVGCTDQPDSSGTCSSIVDFDGKQRAEEQHFLAAASGSTNEDLHKRLLSDPRGSGWILVYVDFENDVLLVGDDPWE
ncbi:hypothetical protein MLD38_024805 [Melastoma candidum]|uniref:Uncharacterized protein n=1 Tax=Melastoma candidum TaxID=119954 RepID=A0ACB9P089_9MYRT|nr:hypothetical protein MLD38_024805 [Melastoma candidum]